MANLTVSPAVDTMMQASDQAGIKSAIGLENAVLGEGITNIVSISRTDYDNLPLPDAQTLYIVNEDA